MGAGFCPLLKHFIKGGTGWGVGNPHSSTACKGRASRKRLWTGGWGKTGQQ